MKKRRKNVKGIPSMLLPKFSNKLAVSVDRALDLIEQGALDQAEDILLPIFEDFPNEVRVIMAVVMMFQAQGEYNEALALAERLVRTHPHDLRGRMIALGVKIDIGYAALVYDELKAMSPEKLNSGFREIYANYLSIVEELLRESFAEIGTEYDDATKHRIVLLQDQHDYALRVERYENAEQSMGALVDIQPDVVAWRLLYSDLLFHSVKLYASMEQAQKGLEIDPKNLDCAARIVRVQFLLDTDNNLNLPLASPLSEEISYFALEALLFRNELETIVALKDRIVEIDEDFRREALALLGMVLLKKGMVEEAEHIRSLMADKVEDDNGAKTFGVSAMTVIPGVLLNYDHDEDFIEGVISTAWFTRAINFLLRYGHDAGLYTALMFVTYIRSPEFIPALMEFVGEEQRGLKQARDGARELLSELSGEAPIRVV